ncbi:helix-turn-helix domain-containing protein [Dongia deserti]|uniref:helix-turn-helix domain-containing protein n=1 Tax=Dongia deserti TaxID=2268030 RepID=UPI0013C4D5C6|nr:helix-turn-helix domain-containing protein [Dongia deserti]
MVRRAEVPPSKPGQESPSYQLELGLRIKAASERIGTRVDAARAGGISDDQLARIIKGQSQPSFATAAGIAEAAGISLRWLATGHGEMETPDRGEIELAKRVRLPISSYIRSGDHDHRILREALITWLRFKPERHDPAKAEDEADTIIDLYLGKLAREIKDVSTTKDEDS